MNPLLPLFLEEVQELIERASSDLLALERSGAGPGRAASLDSAFRAFHTLKGAAALFDFGPMTQMLHAAEDLLGEARDGRAPMEPPVVDGLLRCLDDVQSWLPGIEATETLPPGAPAQAARTQALLVRWLADARAGAPRDPAVGTPPDRARQPPAAAEHVLALLEEQAALLGGDPQPATRAAAACVAANACRAAGLGGAAARIAAADAAGLPGAIRAALEAAAAVEPAAKPAAARALRVAPGRVEHLVALAGEAVITKNALQHGLDTVAPDTRGQDLAQALKAPMATLDRLVRDWHEAAVRLRMVPVSDVFMRFPRLVRDLARALGRDVALRLSGEQLEADRDVLESLFEPLMHLVRNSLDHGIEDAAARHAAGKPAVATLSLRAHAAAETLVIEVEDDGRGLDTGALRGRAVSRGLMGGSEAACLSEQAAAELIFLPGLSTAAAVSPVSGRGVGMDAVRNAVGLAGGQVSLANRPGRGLRVTLILPMQVSVTRIMTVYAGGTRFGVPLDAVSRVVRVPHGRIRALPAPGAGDAGRAFAVGEEIVPLVRLADALGLAVRPSGDMLTVVLVETADGTAGLEVERTGDRADVVLRPLAGLLAGTPAYLGSALLGDGGVLLILDVQTLLQ